MTDIDSRVIIDSHDASQLLGSGDMFRSNMLEVTRVQCALVNEEEINRIVKSIAQQRII